MVRVTTAFIKEHEMPSIPLNQMLDNAITSIIDPQPEDIKVYGGLIIATPEQIQRVAESIGACLGPEYAIGLNTDSMAYKQEFVTLTVFQYARVKGENLSRAILTRSFIIEKGAEE